MTSQSLQILVIGGYGVFGGRLIRLLADDEVLPDPSNLEKIMADNSNREAVAILIPIKT